MKKKKILNAALSLSLALAMTAGLTGCNNNTPAPEPDPEPAPVVTEPAAEPAPEEPKAAALSVTEENTYSKPLTNIPEVPYWFPADLLEWDPASDEAAAYNVSSIPLAKRVDKSALTPSNATQNKDMNVVAISIMNASTSGNAPHGLNTAVANVFSYWQYIDKLVYWGGSSGEGLIVVPSADVIDAAHTNGVPVLGTVFFPQAGHGGKIEWLDDFLQKDDSGNFPMIDKLIQVCEYFGFDGWFINQETEGSEENGLLTADHAALMQEFIKAFKAKTGDSLELMWYDSMTVDGEMDWQNALTDKNKYAIIGDDQEQIADSMFLNFWWNTNTYAPDELLKATLEKANELGVDPYDLYAGIDVQANGYDTPVRWNLFAPDGQAPYTSLGLYCPSWTFFAADDFFTSYQKLENRFWVNENGDPFVPSTANKEENKWVGISTYAIEQTVVNEIPFVTNFDMGHGYSFFIDGQKVSDKDWNNRSMQDVLPTYRWHIEQGEGSQLQALMDYGDAWYGGTSLKLMGRAAKDQSVKVTLYSAQLPMTADTSFTVKAKASNNATLNLVLGVDGSTQTITGDQKMGADWTTITYDVSALAGKTVTSIGFELISAEDGLGAKFYLGQIAVTEGEDPVTAAVSGLKVDSTSFDDDDCMYSGVRLSWESSGEADYYEIYRVNQDGSISFLNATPSTNYYINGLERNDDTNKTTFQVVPVNITGERGEASAAATMDWPDNSQPKADFKALTTLAAPGQEIVFESACSANTESVTWEFPGADVESSTDASPKVTYSAEGTYSVKITAKNASGEAVEEKENWITISSSVGDGLVLLSQGKDTEASSFVNENEAPPFAVDGDVTKKWCATGNPSHVLTIDLGSVMTVSEVKISHAEAGGESSTMNTKAYTLLVSEDGEEFTEVAKVLKNTLGETVDAFRAVNARYVRLSVDKPTQGSDTAARIYEVEVYGLEGGL